MTRAPSETPRLGSKHRILLALERFSRERYRTVFLVALLVTAAGIYFGSKLTIESDILALIPEGNRQVDTFRAAVSDFGAISHLILLLEAGADQGPDELEEFSDVLAERLAALPEVQFKGELLPMIERVEYRLKNDPEFLELLYENALLFLPPEALDELKEKLSDSSILQQIERNRLLLSSPTASFTQELMVNDPLDLMPLFLNRLLGNRGVFRVDLSSGYYLSLDGRSLIMQVKPTLPWQDMEFDRLLLEAVQQAVQETREELGQEDEKSGIRVRFAGHYANAVDEQKLIQQDVKFNLLFSLLAVSALYWICYRRFAALLYCSIPLLIGQAMTFGLAYFVLGGLNASSSAFTALLMGLGTDFVIVMYARYVEERQLGLELSQATERMVGETGLGVFTGAITSAGTFYAMCISQFRGLRDLGFLIGSGILVCAVTIVFLVPAMIKWNEGVRRRKVASIKKLHVQSFLLEYLIPFSARHRVPVIVTIVLLTAGSAYLATQLEFDDSVQVLRSNRAPSYLVQADVAERFGASLSYMMAIAESPTRDEALALTEKIAQRLQPFLADGTVTAYDSILNYLPPVAQQEQVLAAVRSDDTGAFDRERIRRTFMQGLDRSGFRPEAFDRFLDRMESFLAPGGTIDLDDLERRGLQHLVERYVRAHENGVRVVTYLSMSDPRWKRNPPPGLAQALTGGDPGIVITGTNVVSGEFRAIFSREAPRAVLIGLFVVLVLLLIDFRSVKLTAVALAQLISGVILMLGLMKLAGHSLNYVNAFVATMTLGVGIDYSIHLLHRMSASGGRMEPGLLETGKAVVIAALTNIAAFGTLALGNYPALRSFGIVALFGSATCLLTSLTLVPAIMARPKDS